MTDTTREHQIGMPSPEEGVLLELNAGNYDPAIQTALDGLAVGKSPGVLSIVKADLVEGFASGLRTALVAQESVNTEDVIDSNPKTVAFNRLFAAAEAGDPAAISALPKLATSAGQLMVALELTLDNIEAISEWRSGRPLVQFIGSFNPQHVGHRSTIRDTLAVAGENASGAVQAVANHPIKKDSIPPYDGRFRQGEDRLYSSTLLDPTTVTMLDLPLSLGLAKKGTEQIRLIAALAGDERMRWLVGSDKFMSDVDNVRAGKELNKAGLRFENVHIYVARRDTQTIEEIEEGAAYVRERFGAEITLVPETADQLILQTAASKIRALRAKGRHADADAMEYADLPSLRPRR